jgi:hypothetical protein
VAATDRWRQRTRRGARTLLVALVGGPMLIGLVFLVGALLPSAGPGTVGAAETSPVTLTSVLSWLGVGLALVLTVGGWELGARTRQDEDRTWAIGAVTVGVLGIVGSLGIAIGRTAAPQIAWETIAAAGGPIAAGLVIVLALLTAERLRLVGDLPAAKRCDRSPWGLGLGALLLLDRLVPESASISAVFGGAASMLSLFLIAAGIYGGVLLGSGLARLGRDDGGVADLSANDG